MLCLLTENTRGPAQAHAAVPALHPTLQVPSWARLHPPARGTAPVLLGSSWSETSAPRSPDGPQMPGQHLGYTCLESPSHLNWCMLDFGCSYPCYFNFSSSPEHHWLLPWRPCFLKAARRKKMRCKELRRPERTHVTVTLCTHQGEQTLQQPQGDLNHFTQTPILWFKLDKIMPLVWCGSEGLNNLKWSQMWRWSWIAFGVAGAVCGDVASSLF